MRKATFNGNRYQYEEIELTKTEMKEKARDVMAEAIGTAYYKICDDDDYSEEEKEIILHYLDKFGKAAAKAIGRNYTTY